MNSSKIIVKITPGQPMQIDVQGVTGTSCTELTKPLEEMGVVESQELKPEYFETATIVNTTINQQGF